MDHALPLGCTPDLGPSDSFRGGEWANTVDNSSAAAAGLSNLLEMIKQQNEEMAKGK